MRFRPRSARQHVAHSQAAHAPDSAPAPAPPPNWWPPPPRLGKRLRFRRPRLLQLGTCRGRGARQEPCCRLQGGWRLIPTPAHHADPPVSQAPPCYAGNIIKQPLCMPPTCLVVLQPVQQDVQVECRKVVAHKHVGIDLAQARHQHGQQRALVGLRGKVGRVHGQVSGCQVEGRPQWQMQSEWQGIWKAPASCCGVPSHLLVPPPTCMDSMAPPLRRPMSDWLALRTSASKPAQAEGKLGELCQREKHANHCKPNPHMQLEAPHPCTHKRSTASMRERETAPAGKGWLSSLRSALKWRRCAALFHSSCGQMRCESQVGHLHTNAAQLEGAAA